MKNSKAQLTIHGKDAANADAYMINYSGVKIEKVNKVENENYVFLDLVISANAKPGTVNIKADSYTINFELKPRRAGSQGFKENLSNPV